VKVDRHNAKGVMQIFREKNKFYKKTDIGFKKKERKYFFCEGIGKRGDSPFIIGKKNTPSVF
jgi:hypothetical protein